MVAYVGGDHSSLFYPHGREETWIKVHRSRPRLDTIAKDIPQPSTSCNEGLFVFLLPLNKDTTYESIKVLGHSYASILMILPPPNCLQRNL